MEAARRLGRAVRIRTTTDLPSRDSATGPNKLKDDDGTSFKDALFQLCIKDSPERIKPHIGLVLNIISKHVEKQGCDIAGFSLLDLFICFRIPLLNESKAIRMAGLRLIRLCLVNKESTVALVESKLHHFIAKCVDVFVDNLAERVQALRLCRKLLLLNPSSFPAALGGAIVALALDGGKEKDRLVRACLALLGELCVLNPSVFVSCGGVRCFSAAILDCSSVRMQEAMVSSFLHLLNSQQCREISRLDLCFLLAPYGDFHYKHYADTSENTNNQTASNSDHDREYRLLCAKQALLSVLRSWPGLLHIMSCGTLNNLVQILRPNHLETRKAMLEFFYTLLRLPLPEWTDEFSVAIVATDPSRVRDAWKLQDGYVAQEAKVLLPHISKSRPNLVLNHTALLVYCLVEADLIQTLVAVIVTSDTFISVRATVLLGELLHLSSTLLPPACHGTNTCLPKLIEFITSSACDPLERHRAAQAAVALTRIHELKKNGVHPRSLALKQIVELEMRYAGTLKARGRVKISGETVESTAATLDKTDERLIGEAESEVRSNRDPDGILFALTRDSGVLVQKDPLLWNWSALSNVFLWTKIHLYALEDSSVRLIVRRVMHFYKPSSNQFCQCDITNSRTRLYSSVGCLLFDFLTASEEIESDRIMSEFLEDLSTAIRDITQASSAHDSLLSPGRLTTTACHDYFLFIGRLSSSNVGIASLEKAGIFQDLLELVANINHDCYLKAIVSTLNYHSDGFARAILKKILTGTVESGRIYATQFMRVLFRVATENGTACELATWAIPLLLNQLKDKCRSVVMVAASILDEITDDAACIEILLPMLKEYSHLIKQQESLHLDSRGNLLLVKILSTPSGFKLWHETCEEVGSVKVSLVQKELDHWISQLNVRYVKLIESDLSDGLTQHQRADDGRYGRLSSMRQTIRELPVPPHLFSQLNQHREGLDFLRTSGQLSKIFGTVRENSVACDQDILQLKAAMWASAHLGTSEAGVSLLDSAQVVDTLIKIAGTSPILTLRGTAFFCLNLIAMTAAGVDLLVQHGWASVKQLHGELWSVIDEAEWTCTGNRQVLNLNVQPQPQVNHLDVLERNRCRTISQSSGYSVTFANANCEVIANSSGVISSTPQRSNVVAQPETCWETDSQQYSLEGSSIQLDSDSDHSTAFTADANRSSRRAYTLPPLSQAPGQDFIGHSRSFSDSQYHPGDESALTGTTSAAEQPKREMRFLTKLRTSFRLRKSKRFSLSIRKSRESSISSPPSSPVQLLSKERLDFAAPLATAEETFSSTTEGASSDCDDEDNYQETTQSPPPAHYSYQLNRIGSILSRLKSVPFKRRPVGRSDYFIGLCLPVKLSYLHPPKAWFEWRPFVEEPSTELSNLSISLTEEFLFRHDTDQCVLCSFDPPTMPNDSQAEQTEDERWLVRKELLRLVNNMGSSVGLNANEQGLLRLKQRFPWAFQDVCLFSDVCHVLATYGYRLRARRFLHELFMDSPFDELYSLASLRLQKAPEICLK